MTSLLTAFPDPKTLLALPPEDLGEVLIEVIPAVCQSAGFTIGDLEYQLFPVQGSGYPQNFRNEVVFALAESVGWLVSQGIVMPNPTQSASWYTLTRRGRSLKSRADVAAYRKSRALPVELLESALVSKVHHLFVRGDYDTAAFQAFKEIEVAVRNAAGLPTTLLGRDLMQRAFKPDTGPLTDRGAVTSEREAQMFLFSGAIGHAKNPLSHREVNLTLEESAHLIVFASYLLGIVNERARALEAKAKTVGT
jgi:uncharacterized protein (TIGR02391 family)